MDSDAVLKKDLDSIVKSYSAVFVNACDETPNAIFNGFIVIPARHPIMKDALTELYNTSNADLKDDYFMVTRQLFPIVNKYKDANMYFLKERMVQRKPEGTYCEVEDPATKEVVYIHYPDMDIPNA